MIRAGGSGYSTNGGNKEGSWGCGPWDVCFVYGRCSHMPTYLEIGKPIAISGNWQTLGEAAPSKGQQSPNMSKHQIQKLENVGWLKQATDGS